jgi:opacity protein-like surface antigen
MVQIIRRAFWILLFLTGSQYSYGQFTDGGIMLGGAIYEGDLSPIKYGDKLQMIRPAGGIFFRQNFNKNISLRLSVQVAKIMGDDKIEGRTRNLSFQSNLMEVAAVVEYQLLGFDPVAGDRFSPYLFAGAGYFHYNPETEFDGRLIELQPLGTEGQRLPSNPGQDFYKLGQFSVPVGGGIKYALSSSITLGLEFGARRTFTDYLDDVSGTYASYRELAEQRSPLAAMLADRTPELTGSDPVDRGGDLRGNPDQKDWYFIGNLTISYNFFDLFSNVGNGRRLGCPGI